MPSVWPMFPKREAIRKVSWSCWRKCCWTGLRGEMRVRIHNRDGWDPQNRDYFRDYILYSGTYGTAIHRIENRMRKLQRKQKRLKKRKNPIECQYKTGRYVSFAPSGYFVRLGSRRGHRLYRPCQQLQPRRGDHRRYRARLAGLCERRGGGARRARDDDRVRRKTERGLNGARFAPVSPDIATENPMIPSIKKECCVWQN